MSGEQGPQAGGKGMRANANEGAADTQGRVRPSQTNEAAKARSLWTP